MRGKRGFIIYNVISREVDTFGERGIKRCVCLSVCDEIGDFPQYGRERTRDGEEEGEGRRDRCRTSAASNYYRMFANRIDLHRPDFSFPVYRWKWWTSCVQSDVCVCAGFLGLPWEALICIRMVQKNVVVGIYRRIVGLMEETDR